MPSIEHFKELVANSYRNLYDMVQLRTDPLAQYLVSDSTLTPIERAWRLHHILMKAIQDLNQGMDAPIQSKAWRKHRLLWLRYVEALDAQAVAEQLAISKRQFYREHNEGLDHIAKVLYDSVVPQVDLNANLDLSSSPALATDYLDLLRLEATRVKQSQSYVELNQLIQEVLGISHEMLQQRGIRVEDHLIDDLPPIAIDRGLLRQLILGMISFATNCTQSSVLMLRVHRDTNHVLLTIDVRSDQSLNSTIDAHQQIDALKEIARIANVNLLCLDQPTGVVSLQARLVIGMNRTILVVDDNADMLSLYRRYLTPHHYNVIVEESAKAVTTLVRQVQPFALILDLMMPDRDGWDVLQTVTSEPDTQHVPIIVCSVLKQRELALALGASQFLEKPVSEHQLVAALQALFER